MLQVANIGQGELGREVCRGHDHTFCGSESDGQYVRLMDEGSAVEMKDKPRRVRLWNGDILPTGILQTNPGSINVTWI